MKQRIRLTESQLHNVIKNSVKRTLSEGYLNHPRHKILDAIREAQDELGYFWDEKNEEFGEEGIPHDMFQNLKFAYDFLDKAKHCVEQALGGVIDSGLNGICG